MATVSVPAAFFRSELRVYGDWRTAFARELLQNATDANPTKIEATFDNVDGHGRVTFRDDGHGMSRQVLEDVFFALGQTTKTGADSIGGFGRARIIICFAQTSYQIRTGNLLVTGHGGEYTITEVEDYQRGCEFVIDLLDETCDQVRDAFERLLRSCSLHVPVRINGELAGMTSTPNRATRVMRDEDGSPWGRVYVTPTGYARLLVRVHGLTMFSRWINGNDSVVLELEPRRSREVLSASRDTLHTQFGDQLDQFISDLAGNRRRALSPPVQPLNVQVGGGGFLATDATDLTARPTGGGVTGEAADSADAVTGGGPGEGRGRVRVTPANEAAYANTLAAHATAGTLFDGFEPAMPEPAAPSLGFDVFMIANDNDARVRRLAKAWNPAGWDERTGARRRSLLLTWKAAIAYALDVFVTAHPELGRVLWTVGWTFDTDVEALHRSSGGGHVFALNPVTEDGGRKFTLSSRASRAKLFALAAHEVCHVLTDDHDERYAGLLTDLFGDVDPIVADRAMRTASR